MVRFRSKRAGFRVWVKIDGLRLFRESRSRRTSDPCFNPNREILDWARKKRRSSLTTFERQEKLAQMSGTLTLNS